MRTTKTKKGYSVLYFPLIHTILRKIILDRKTTAQYVKKGFTFLVLGLICLSLVVSPGLKMRTNGSEPEPKYQSLSLTQGVPQTLWYNETVPYQGAVEFRVLLGVAANVSTVINITVVTEGFRFWREVNYYTNTTAARGDLIFLRISEAPCVLGFNCTLLAPYQQLTIRYYSSQGRVLFHLTDSSPQETLELRPGWPWLIRAFIYSNSTSPCTLKVQPINASYSLLPNESLELALELRKDYGYELILSLNESDIGAEVYGIMLVLVLGLYEEPSVPLPTPGFSEGLVCLTLLLAGGLLWHKKRQKEFRS